MAEDKDEGEVQGTSSGASVEEGDFSSGLDNQISTIEEQLQRAEATLFDLQSLRGKLEAERQRNLSRAQEEKEMQEALSIKKENDRLRKELREYHGEIGSLKEIISSLKDDLVKTAEKLETKVNRTLHAIGEGEIHDTHAHLKPSHIQHREPHKSHVDKPKDTESRNFFSDHLDPKPKKVEVTLESEVKKEEQITPAETASIVAPQDKAPGNEEISEAVVAPAESAPVQVATPAKEEAAEVPLQPAALEAPAEPVHEAASTTSTPAQPVLAEATQSTPPVPAAEAQQGSLVDQFLGDAANVGSVQPVVITNVQDAAQTAEDLVDDDFDEYEEIKRELEALEQESLFKPHAPATVSTEETTQAESKKPSGKKNLLSIFSKKPKASTETKAEARSAAPEALSAPEEMTAKAEPAQPQASAPLDQAPTVQEKSAEEDSLTSSPVTAETPQPQMAEVDRPANGSEENPAPDAVKPKASLANIFKRKKKKIRGEVKDGRDSRDDDHVRRGGGKLAISAAIIILLAVLSGVAYKIKNAENLRQTYISKATESVAIASLNTNKSETPDEFLNSDPAVKYKEAFVDLPFAETAWATHTDPDMGITIEYPKNTSYRLKPVGSNNLWFLRKEGYLLKIEKLDTTMSLGEVRDSVLATGVKYGSETVVVRGNTTIHLMLEDDLPVKGNIYLTTVKGSTYKIWYKTFSSEDNPDDAQRVQKMLESLDFIAGS